MISSPGFFHPKIYELALCGEVPKAANEHHAMICRQAQNLFETPTGIDKGRHQTGTMAMPVTIYGIKNCDTMKKAFDWLKTNNIAHQFHDYRAEGIDAATVGLWCEALGWEKVLNKASTTFKSLPDADKADLNEQAAIALMVREPTMIKRPVFAKDGQFAVGFKPESGNLEHLLH
jgi:Spx/MgsR family transcriptional regulator